MHKSVSWMSDSLFVCRALRSSPNYRYHSARQHPYPTEKTDKLRPVVIHGRGLGDRGLGPRKAFWLNSRHSAVSTSLKNKSNGRVSNQNSIFDWVLALEPAYSSLDSVSWYTSYLATYTPGFARASIMPPQALNGGYCRNCNAYIDFTSPCEV